MGHAALEREVKLRFLNPGEARAAVVAAGALPLHDRRLQDDCLLDTPDGTLKVRGCVLRVRTEGGHSRITWKGPVLASTMKLREEFETSVGDGGVLLGVFEKLGYRPCFRYQKYREEFAGSGVVVAVDETPIGTFVELEGTEAGISAMTAGLGRGSADYVLDSYRALFIQWQQRHGRREPHMVFEPA